MTGPTSCLGCLSLLAAGFVLVAIVSVGLGDDGRVDFLVGLAGLAVFQFVFLPVGTLALMSMRPTATWLGRIRLALLAAGAVLCIFIGLFAISSLISEFPSGSAPFAIMLLFFLPIGLGGSYVVIRELRGQSS